MEGRPGRRAEALVTEEAEAGGQSPGPGFCVLGLLGSGCEGCSGCLSSEWGPLGYL